MQHFVTDSAALAEARRVLYGQNQGRPVQMLAVDAACSDAARVCDFDLQARKCLRLPSAQLCST